MQKIISKIVAVLVIIVLIQGCATTPYDSSGTGNGGESSGIIQGINDILDRYIGPVKSGEHELLLLRAHLVVAMFARYGAARFGDYSSDPENDATKLLGRIWVAESSLAKALEAAHRDAPFYPVERTDLALGVIDVVAVATKPTRRGLTYHAISTSPMERLKQGKTILKNALEDKLYAEAYKEGFKALVKKVSQRPDQRLAVNDWKTVNDFLLDACQRLREIAKTEQQCIPEGIPQTEVPGTSEGKEQPG